MRWWWLVLGLTSMRLSNAEASVPDARDPDHVAKFALIVGKNEPEETGQATLRYADDDAISMHRLLQEAGIKSVLLVSPDQDTARLHDIHGTKTPTLGAVLRAFAGITSEINAARKRGQRTEFFFFYSGHGDVSEGEGFVVLDNSRLTRTDLLEKIVARSPAHANHVIIDACKSYFMVFNKGPGGERRPFDRAFGGAASGKNLDRTGFVLSASSDEDSHEWERYQAGIFSYEVRSALRGGADANRDGRITYGELGAFVTTANKGIVNPKFRPNFLVTPPGREPGNLSNSLLFWEERHGSLMVDVDAAVHFYVETSTGIRIVDVHPTRAQKLTLHLPEVRPLFIRWANDKAEGVLDTGKTVRLSSVSFQPTAVARKGALNIAFESLFSTPFGAVDVNAYEAEETGLYAREQAKRRDAQRRLNLLRYTLFGTATGALVVGGTMSLLAMKARHDAEAGAQQEVPSMNETIDKYNTAAIVFYSVAAAAGISWLTVKLWSIRKTKRTLAVYPIVVPSGCILGLGGKFGR